MKTFVRFCVGFAGFAVGTVFAAPAGGPYFSMRCDDNHSPREWRQVAEIFEAEGFRVSFAIVSGTLSDEQGACLKELAARGHELMDHTAQHAFYNLRCPDAATCAALTNAPFASEVVGRGTTLLCRPEIDWNHKSAFRFMGSIRDGEVIVADKAALKRLHFTAKFFVPSLGRWFGVKKVDGDRREILDFWRRPLPKDFVVPETEMLTLSQDAIQPSVELLRAQAMRSRLNFERFGLPKPTFWIQPGGWESFLCWRRLRDVFGKEFGYHGADAIVGRGHWKGGGNDPDADRGRWSFPSDFAYFDEGKDLDAVKRRVAEALANGRSFSYISHMNGRRCGGWDRWLEQTRAFVGWLKTSGVRVTTHTKLVDAVFGKASD